MDFNSTIQIQLNNANDEIQQLKTQVNKLTQQLAHKDARLKELRTVNTRQNRILAKDIDTTALHNIHHVIAIVEQFKDNEDNVIVDSDGLPIRHAYVAWKHTYEPVTNIPKQMMKEYERQQTKSADKKLRKSARLENNTSISIDTDVNQFSW